MAFTIAFQGERCERTLVSVLDISQQKAAERAWQEQAYYLDNINRVARVISSNLDLETIVQTVTDTATALCGAKFGAFFYNSVDQHGERYTLYALSGARARRFARFPIPRNTALFEATFRERESFAATTFAPIPASAATRRISACPRATCRW